MSNNFSQKNYLENPALNFAFSYFFSFSKNLFSQTLNLLKIKPIAVFLLFISLNITFSNNAFSQVSTLGKNFWLGFMDIGNNDGPFQKLYISGQTNTTATISIPLQNWTTNVNIVANQITTVTLPNTSVTTSLNRSNEVVKNTGIHITAPELISVFASHESSARTEASVVLPTTALGGTTEYYVASYHGVFGALNGVSNTPGNGVLSRSQFMIVSYQDGTTVEITPTCVTRNGRPANQPFQVTLNEGETYLVQANAPTAPNLPNNVDFDLTGTRIVGTNSCKPFAVFSGNTATLTNSSCSAWEHLYEQQFPIQSWGKKYLITPFKNAAQGYIYRVLGSENNTSVVINGASTFTVNKGGFLEFNVGNATNICVDADKPIAVAQFIKGQDCNGVPMMSGSGGGQVNVGDPAMLMLNPVEQTINKISYTTIASSNMTGSNPAAYFVNVITKTANTSKVKRNGAFIGSAQFAPFSACQEYSWAMVDIAAGTHILESDSSFIAYSYGYGRAEGYAYSVGAKFDNLNRNFNVSKSTICIGETVNFSGFGTGILAYNWTINDANGVVATPTGQNQSYTYLTPGEYDVKMTVTILGGCGFEDVIKKITVLPFPNPDLGVPRIICPGTSITLDPGVIPNSPTYLWSNGATTRTITVSEPGTYIVTVTNLAGCQRTNGVQVDMYPVVPLNFVGLNPTYCIDAPSFPLQATPAGGSFTINNIAATQFNPGVLGVGDYTVVYTYQNPTNGCIFKKTMMVSVKPLPVVAILDLQDEYCIDAPSMILIGDAMVQTPNPTKIFTINGVVATNFNPAVLGAGTHIVKFTYIDNFSCVGTTIRQVKVNPLPVLQITNLQTAYCVDAAPISLTALPAGGTFKVNNIAQPQNEIELATFNPNTLGIGTYLVKYSYQDAKGCKNNITQNVTVNPLPIVEITNLREIYCKNNVNVTLTANVTGGIFTVDNTPTTELNFNALGVGEHEVIYTFINNNSCLNRDTVKFMVEETPIVKITGLQFVYCIDSNPFALTASPQPDQGGIGIFTINGNPTPVTQVNPATLGGGIHTVRYIFTDSRTQCTQIDTKTFEVSGLPSVSIVNIGGLKDEYCRDEAQISLVGIGTPSGGTFTINGIVKTVLNPADTDLRIGANTILYNYTNANGCTNVASKIITILPLPETKITNIRTNYCVQLPAYQLTAIPLNGTFKINDVASNGNLNVGTLGAGTHKITYTEPKGCVTFTKMINVYPAIPALPVLDYGVCSNSGNPEILDAGEGKKYKWTPGIISDTLRFKSVFVMGTYTVEVTDSLGCKTINEITVKEDCDPKVFLPTAFTPNGDNLNDTFELKGKDYTNVKCYVYSRWGEIIHVSYENRLLWDGNMRNGNPAPDGAYIIDLKYDELPNKIGKQIRQYVVLKR